MMPVADSSPRSVPYSALPHAGGDPEDNKFLVITKTNHLLCKSQILISSLDVIMKGLEFRIDIDCVKISK